MPQTDTVAAPEPHAGSGAVTAQSPGRAGPLKSAGAALARYAGVLPFAVYVALGLLIPVIAIIVGAFQAPGTGALTTANLDTATHGVYLQGFQNSLILSVLASVIPGILGLLIAYAIFTAKRGRVLRQVVITASGVFANFGGVPLAFLFIASFGSTALVTGWLGDMGLHIWDWGFTLYNLAGVVLVYLYFQIPLMVLVILPALEGLRPAWREAAENLGARGWQYWRYVGGPVLAPPVIGATMLLFASAFAAYATARALVGSSIPLVTLQIADALSSNVVVGSENLGKALALGMVLLIGVVMAFYAWVQRRTQRWLS